MSRTLKAKVFADRAPRNGGIGVVNPTHRENFNT